MFSELIRRIKQVLFYLFSRVDFPKNDESNEEKDKFFMLSVNADFDLKTRHYWHTKAAQAGHVQAMAEEGNFILYGWVEGTLEDAFEYYKKSAEAGIKKSYANMADCYLYGWGTEQDFQKARECYKKASWWKNRKIIKKIDSEDFRKGIDGCKKLKLIRDFYN